MNDAKTTIVDHRPALDARSAAFDRVGACAAVLDGDGVIVDTNRAWRLYSHLNDGAPETTGIGMNYLDVCDRAAGFGVAGSSEVAAGLREILSGERSQMDMEYPCPSPTEDRWFLVQASALPVSGGTGAVVFHVDITARRQLIDQLSILAEHDALTGLPDRQAAGRHLDERLQLARDAAQQVWMLSVTVAELSTVNDTWGRHVGDELVVTVGRRVRRTLRGEDFLCRASGDEYAVICSGVDHPHVGALADRLRTVMSAPFQIGDLELRTQVSIALIEISASPTGRTALDLRTPGTAMSPDRSGPQADERTRAAAAMTFSNDLVLFFAADGTIEWVSPACAHLFGIRPDDIVGRNGFDLIHVDDRPSAIGALRSIPNLGDRVTTDFRILDADGRVRWIEEIATNLLDDPAVGCIVGNLHDVTERVELLERIELDRRRLADAQAAARLGTFEVDVRTGVISRSDEVCRILGVATGSSTTTHGLDAVHPDDRTRVVETLEEALAGRDQFEIEYRIVRPCGEVRWVHSHGVRLIESNSDVIAGSMLDITDRRAADEALAFQASHDWLTELPNPASLQASLQQTLAGVTSHTRVLVAAVGIDNFGHVSDICGASTGDDVLRAIATRLRSRTEPGDLVGRIRGDEFIVARHVGADVCASEFGRELRDLLGEPLELRADHVAVPRLSFSVGVTVNSDGDSPESMLADADAAMHDVKRAGGDSVLVFSDEARARATRRRNITSALPLALERNELRLEYQPIVDLVSLRTVGFEALLRWTHPDLGPIAPEEFIPIAEANRLIVPIGGWLLDRALRQLAEWHRSPGVSVELWMAVNVSAQQLTAELPNRIQDALDRTGVPPESVHLEITESVLMDRIDQALTTIADVQSLGVSISIDDFGTGYSSLSYLSRLPVDVIKIDGSFVEALSVDGDGSSIIGAMISLADGLELDTVAEGVETNRQLDQLRALGCTYGQGFLWSRALHPDDALHWIGERDRAAQAARVVR